MKNIENEGDTYFLVESSAKGGIPNNILIPVGRDTVTIKGKDVRLRYDLKTHRANMPNQWGSANTHLSPVI